MHDAKSMVAIIMCFTLYMNVSLCSGDITTHAPLLLHKNQPLSRFGEIIWQVGDFRQSQMVVHTHPHHKPRIPTKSPHHMNTQHTSTPHMIISHMIIPHMITPHTSTPHTSTPHTSTPHTSTPHMSTPHTSTPHQATNTCLVYAKRSHMTLWKFSLKLHICNQHNVLVHPI